MDIDISYDASVSAAPSWFKTAVNYAVAQMDALIANPITLNVTFSWGQENNNVIGAGDAGQNQSLGSYVDYATLTSALSSHATTADDRTAVATLTSTNPFGSSQFYVPTALQKALGLDAATATSTDGYVGLNSSLNWSPSANGQVSVGQYDPVACLEHEISEVMGRVAFLSDTPRIATPLDLFRYSAPGQRDLAAGSGSFSVDGKTMETAFGNPGDAADWAPSVIGDEYGNTTAGVANAYSATDLQVLDVLGYTIGTPLTNVAATAAAAPTSSLTTPAASPAPAVTPSQAPASDSVAPGAAATHYVPYDATLYGAAGSKTFVFRAHPGECVISNFIAGGASHDTLSFADSTVSSVAAVLRETRQVGNDVVITLDAHDAITLQNTTVAALRQHHADFTFHA